MIERRLTAKELSRVNAVLTEWADLFSETYQDKVQWISSSGDLASSVTFSVEQNGDSWEVKLNLLSYWKWIEYGRRPGRFPPVDAMIEYVRQKPIIPKPYTLPSGRQVIPTENQLAFLIGRKIKEDGIGPRPLMAETMEQLQQTLIENLTKAFGDDVTEHLNLIFNT